MKFYFADDLMSLTHKTLKPYKAKLRKPDHYLITRIYDPQAWTPLLADDLEAVTINMFDYFQKACFIPCNDLHVRLSGTFDLSSFTIKGINNNQSDLYQGVTKIAEIQIAPSTVQLIGTVSFLNPDGFVTSKDLYDRRGFLSSTQYLDLDGNFGHQIIYDVTGQPVIEVVTMEKNYQRQITGVKLLNYHGADYWFTNFGDLWKFFKNEIKKVDLSKLKVGDYNDCFLR